MLKTTNGNIALSQGAQKAIFTLENAGFEAWAVGGCVRDAIFNKVATDFDVATNATPEQTEILFNSAGSKTFDVGKKHGTISVLFDFGTTETVEITTYRCDGAYSDSRHPDDVKFVKSIEEDLSRRDFTMNSIAYNPHLGLLDPFGGIEDIKNKTIRTVGEPKKRFSEDALRMLRACRFKSQLGFEIENETWESACREKHRILDIASERITTEVDKLLSSEHVLLALCDCADVLEVALPEITACRGFNQHTKYHAFDVWTHIAHVVDHVKNTQILRWAALCHDLGKPAVFFQDESGQGHFYGHATLSARITKNMLKRFNLKSKTKDCIVSLVTRHNDTLKPEKKSIISTIRLLNGDVWLFRQLLALKRADSLGHASKYTNQVQIYDEIENLLDKMLDEGIVFSVSDLKINGTDIIELGVNEGSDVGKKLDVCLEWIQSGVCKNTRDSLISQLQKHLS